MASRGICKVTLIGTLGQDPETKYTTGGNAVTNISVATSETWKDKNTGQPQERTEWHRVVFFNRLAEIAGEFLQKGTKVYIDGTLRTRKWQAQDGTDRYTTEIVAAEMQVLGNGKQREGTNAPQGAGQQSAQSNAAQQAPQAPQSNQSPAHNGDDHPNNTQNQGFTSQGFDGFDDDIPF